MNCLRFIHIAPELPPTVGGVADYSAILSRRLVEVSDGAAEPVLVHAGRTFTDAIAVGYPAVNLSGKCSATALTETINRLVEETQRPTVVLLEYSGYGYAKRGAPLWLMRGLQKALQRGNVPLVTIFHELYATGRPWSSAFWLSGLQRLTAAALARSSNAVFTNRADAAKWLKRYAAADVPVDARPVFSNVGEPEEDVLDCKRSEQAVIFGGGRKRKVYSEHFSELCDMLPRAGITHVVDVGPTVPSPDWTGSLQVEKRGVLPKKDVSRLLRSSQAGIIYCSHNHLTKSGVMAAYLSHGVAPIVFSKSVSETDLIPNKHFLSGNDLSHKIESQVLSETLFRRIGQAGQEWYCQQAHSKRTARKVLSLAGRITNRSHAHFFKTSLEIGSRP